LKNKLIAVVITSALLVSLPSAAIAGPVSTPASHIEVTSAKKASISDARNLYKALYFGVGPAAESFDSALDDSAYTAFRDMVQEVGPDNKAIDALVSKVEAASPGSLKKWHKELTSGDVLRVEAAFVSGTQNLSDVVAADVQQQKQQQASVMKADPETANPTAAVPVFAVWVAVVSVAGAVHALTAAVQNNVAWTQNAFWASPADGGGTLESEKGIVELTETLQAF
jgi:SdpC family antimicrobial peptide